MTVGRRLREIGSDRQGRAGICRRRAGRSANAGTYYFNEGAVFTNTGKVDEAIAAFDKAIQIDPNNADAYYWKGVNMMGKATIRTTRW